MMILSRGKTWLTSAAVGLLVAGLGVPADAAPRDPASAHRVPGLKQAVRIVVDRWGVPHIYARDTEDLFFAQGFNAARDRLFQMDLWRRRGLGTLSEVLGPAHLERDRATRQFLYRGDMKREWAAYGPEARRAAVRFTEGINAYVDRVAQDPSALPPEFRELGYRPARWRPEDVVRIRSHGLTTNVVSEVIRSLVVCAGGIDAAKFLVTLQPARTPAVPAGFDPCSVTPEVLQTYLLATQNVSFDGKGVRAEPVPPVPPEGSNNWAISPGRTSTGRPVLANDPHRGLTAPSLRYISHLSAPGLDVIGAGEPALPGVSIGHNGTSAFGLTVFGIDQEDLLVYRLDPDDPGRYRYRDGWEPFRTVSEDVPVAGQAPQKAELRFTRHGPVLHVDAKRGLAFALRTTWTEPGTSPYFGSLGYLRARSFEDFSAAMRRWGAPALNQVYADTKGDIGWVPGGRAPERNRYDGLFPVPGDGRYEWTGFHDGAALPRTKNPREGFVATANEYNLPPDHPVQVGYEWEAPYRKQRIDQVLSASGGHSVQDSVRLQGDQLSPPALRLVKLLDGLRSDDPDTARALALLRGYDGVARAGSRPAALLEPWLTNHLMPAFLRAFVSPQAASMIQMRGGNTPLMIEALENPGRWFGPDGAAARDRLLLKSLAAAYADVRKRLGADDGTWKWGALQSTVFRSPTGTHVGPFPRGGSRSSLDYSAYNPSTYEQTGGATFKMVLDVGAWDRSRVLNAPGQSGDPSSPHFRDLVEPWRTGRPFPLLYDRAAVERNAASHLLLIPGG